MMGTLRARACVVAAMTLGLLLGSTVVVSASPPGDNGPLVYTDAAGLYMAQADGSGTTLIKAATDAVQPDVTADAGWALYIEQSSGSLVVVNLTSNKSWTLVASGVTGAAWSPDGYRIAYSTDQVRIADFVAGDPPTMTNDQVAYAAGGRVFDWSPVDDRVIVDRNVDTGGFPEYYFETFDLKTSAVKPLADNGPGLFTWYVIDADFSPDGSRVAYTAASPGYIGANVIDADGTDDHEIAGPEGAWHQGPDGPIVWAPDGSVVGVVTMPDPTVPVISLRNPDTGATEGLIAIESPTGIDWAPAASGGGGGGGGPFADVPSDHVFAADIEWLAESGITKGCNPPDNTNFCPNDNVTRGQMAAFLVRALGYTDNGGGGLFDDTAGSVFQEDIDRLATAGVTKGCNPPDNTNYCPNDNVTRAQMAAFLVRALGYTDNGGGGLFDDTTGSVFQEDIDRLATAGVTKGCNPPDNTNYCPNDFVTRGQMAAFLHRALGD